tara:strand:- start:599 stop:829 length:231 start_codon:yes stop_codon:yes gene_type:complete
MNEQRQEEAFRDALVDLIQRFYDEFDLTYSQMLGALELVKADMVADCNDYVTVPMLEEALDSEEDEDDEDPPNIPK